MPIPYALYRYLLAGGSSLPWHFARRRNGLRENAYPSMVADVERGKPTEVHELNGEIVRLAAAHGLSAPRNQALIEMTDAFAGHSPPPYWTAADLQRRLADYRPRGPRRSQRMNTSTGHKKIQTIQKTLLP